MRLQEMYFLAKTALETWPKIEYADASTNGISYFKIKNISSIDEVLEQIKEIAIVSGFVSDFREVSIELRSARTEATINSREREKADGLYSIMHEKLVTIVDLCESLGLDTSREGFDIKMPPDMTLSEFSACTKELDFIFTQCPIMKADGEIIELSSVDIGSIWLTFAIAGGGIAILGALAALVDKCLTIRSHHLTCKQQEEVVKKLKKSNELLDSVVEANKAVLNELKENAVEELAQKYDVTDPEDNEKLRRSLDLLFEWMNKGLEIYAAIDASDEVKAVFPPIEQQRLPDAATKMLTDGKEQEK